MEGIGQRNEFAWIMQVRLHVCVVLWLNGDLIHDSRHMMSSRVAEVC